HGEYGGGHDGNRHPDYEPLQTRPTGLGHRQPSRHPKPSKAQSLRLRLISLGPFSRFFQKHDIGHVFILPAASILRTVLIRPILGIPDDSSSAVADQHLERRESMFTTRPFHCLLCVIGLATSTFIGLTSPSTVAFAKTHEVSMTAVETEVIIDG